MTMTPSRRSKKREIFQIWKLRKKNWKKLQLQFFRTNDQANKENMLGEKKIWGLVAL